MTADQLAHELTFLKEWKATPAQRLREALALLEKAHNSLDVLEGQVQDLKDSEPSAWEKSVLSALSVSIGEVSYAMEVATKHIPDEYGYSSTEYEAARSFLGVLNSSDTY